MVALPAAEWNPDQPPYSNPISGTVKNCLPLTDKSYGPIQALVSSYSALAARCQGAFGIRDTAENGYIFAGTAAKLYELTASSGGWSDVTNAHNAYTAGSTDTWRFALFGQDVIATDYEDPLQVFTLGTSSVFSDLAAGGITSASTVAGSGYTPGNYSLTVSNAGSGSGFTGSLNITAGGAFGVVTVTNPGRNYPQTATIPNPAGIGAGSNGSITPTIALIAPTAKFVTVVKDFVVVANTNDATNGKKPQRVWWSGAGTDTSWNTLGSNAALAVQSDAQDILGDFGEITGIVPNLPYADAMIFFERAAFRMTYTGPPNIFDFFPAVGVRGCLFPNSIVNTPQGVVYLGEDGFYLTDGLSTKPIGFQKWDKFIRGDIATATPERVVAVMDPVNRHYYMAYPQTVNSMNNPNRLFIWNWMTGRATLCDQITVQTLVTVPALGFNEETIDQGIYNMDTLPYPYDDPVWSGSEVRSLAAFDASNLINYFTGNNISPLVETQEVAPGTTKRARVRRAIPLVDGGTPSLAPVTRSRMEDAPVIGTAVSMNADGYCPLNSEGRYHRFQVSVPSGATWTQLQGVDVPDDAVTITGGR